jgi:hypothetical protein
MFSTSVIGFSVFCAVGCGYMGRLGYDMRGVLVHEKVLSDLLQDRRIQAVYQIFMLGFGGYKTNYQNAIS